MWHSLKINPITLKPIFEGRIEFGNTNFRTVTEPQTLEFVIAHNSNPISPASSLSLQTTEFVDIEPSTPHPNQSQTVNRSEFIVYSRKKKKSQEDIEQWTHCELVHEIEPNSVPKGTYLSNIDSYLNELEDDELNLPIAKRKGVRSCTNHPIYNFISYKSLWPKNRAFVTNLTDIRIPNNIQEALHILEWKTLIEEEIQALEKNGTWEFAKLSKEKNPVGSKWIFIVKYKADGSVGRYKARLVAKGFIRSYKIGYQ